MCPSINLTASELAAAFSDPAIAAKFPPVLTTDQAAALLQKSPATLYDWHSRGLLRGCCRRVGRHLRFFRDRLVLQAFNEGIHAHGSGS